MEKWLCNNSYNVYSTTLKNAIDDEQCGMNFKIVY